MEEESDFEEAIANMEKLAEEMTDMPDWAEAVLEEHFWELLL